MNKENVLKELGDIQKALYEKQSVAESTGDIQTAEQLAQINQKLRDYIQRKEESRTQKTEKR